MRRRTPATQFLRPRTGVAVRSRKGAMRPPRPSAPGVATGPSPPGATSPVAARAATGAARGQRGNPGPMRAGPSPNGSLGPMHEARSRNGPQDPMRVGPSRSGAIGRVAIARAAHAPAATGPGAIGPSPLGATSPGAARAAIAAVRGRRGRHDPTRADRSPNGVTAPAATDRSPRGATSPPAIGRAAIGRSATVPSPSGRDHVRRGEARSRSGSDRARVAVAGRTRVQSGSPNSLPAEPGNGAVDPVRELLVGELVVVAHLALEPRQLLLQRRRQRVLALLPVEVV